MHHLTNLILHIANSVLLFLFFYGVTGSLWRSAFVSAMFALHPLNVDSVAWVAERKNVLSTFFWMLTMLAYTYYSKRPSLFRYLLSFFFFALGLLAKPMLITLPFVLLLLDYWPLRRFQRSTTLSAFSLVIEKIPFFVLSGVAIYLSALSLQGARTMISMESVPMSLRMANALVSYVGYIGKMIWPLGLAVHYPFPHMVPIWKAAGAGLFLLMVSILILLVLKRKPYLSVGWLWFLGTLVPVIGLVQAGLWPAMADRWAYVPLIGLFIMIAWGAPELVTRWRHRISLLACISSAALLLLMILTWMQLQHWKNSITLFEHAVHVTNDNTVAHTALATALISNDKLDEAAAHLHESLRIRPGFPKALTGLGIALAKQGKTTEAIRHFSEALRRNPYSAEIHQNLGIAFSEQGESAKAINHFLEVLRTNPGNAKAHNGLAFELTKERKIDEAISHYLKALQINPGFAEAHNGLGAALATQGRLVEATKHFKKALRINPTFSNARNNLKKALALMGDKNNSEHLRQHTAK